MTTLPNCLLIVTAEVDAAVEADWNRWHAPWMPSVHYPCMQVLEVMTRQVETVAPDASLQQAAMAMEAIGVGSLPVCAGRRLIGTLTDRDIVVRGVATGRSPVEMQVR